MDKLFVPTNLNGFIKVKLTEKGKKIYNEQFHFLNELLGCEFINPTPLSFDSEGYTKFQIHEFMILYGSYLSASTKELPCETNILVQIKPF